jgi:hypothetical protein
MNVPSNSVPKHPLGDRFGLPTSPALLADLRAAHRQIEATLDEIDSIGGHGAPNAAQFINARLRVGQAILASRQIAMNVCSHLISLATKNDAEQIRELQRRDGEQSKLVSNHVRRWTPNAIRDDWQGYCDASRKMREGVREIVSAEKKLLYPLLGHRC